jgi:peptide-methionine (S)-S-oxide reductase
MSETPIDTSDHAPLPAATTAHALATLAGGCFWCLEAVYTELQGVIAVESGYCGGEDSHPTYESVCDGRTGHAEAVRIRFDPTVVGYENLLEIFFAIHDPTTRNRQGNDVGTQYRSAIFCHDAAQRVTATAFIERLTRESVFDQAIVTEVVEAGPWHRAETYHQNYFRDHPGQGYCTFVVAPKVAKFRKLFATRLK